MHSSLGNKSETPSKIIIIIIIYLAKTFFKLQKEIRTFPDKQKLRNFINKDLSYKKG